MAIVIAIILTIAHQYSTHPLILMSTSRGAGEFREQGNRLFSERRYTEAIEAYTSAIVSILIRMQSYESFDVDLCYAVSSSVKVN